MLAGMGGKGLRRKRRVFLIYSLLAGLVVSVVLAVTLYIMNRR